MASGERTRTAYHEAGHAVFCAAVHEVPRLVSIREDGRTLGRSAQRMVAVPSVVAQAYLAGFAAEHVWSRRRPRQLDAEVGLAVLAHTDPALVAEYDGIEATDGYGAVVAVLRGGLREQGDEIRREVDRLYEAARQSLSAVWSAVDRLANRLLEREELDRRAVKDALAHEDIVQPVLAVQRDLERRMSCRSMANGMADRGGSPSRMGDTLGGRRRND